MSARSSVSIVLNATMSEQKVDKPELDTLWQWLEQVPDPEIPVISVVDLGVVRNIQWDEDTVVVTVTPTYSGCPATRVINEDIVQHLASKGLQKVRTERQLAPAWRTAWISDKARQKLLEYGIAPPVEASEVGKRVIVCPQCGSSDTEKVSQFGSTPCKASFRCLACLEPFEYFKCL